MNRSEALIERRKKVVPNGISMLYNSTAKSAKNGVIINEDGQEMIDFAGGIGVINSGHCPEPVLEAINTQAANLIHSCFQVATYEPYVALAEKLVDLFPHGDHTKVMITGSGAESVENAVKIARQATGRKGILCFTGAFHGRTNLTMALTSKVSYKHGSGASSADIYRLPYPNYYRYGDGLSEAAFVERELGRFKEALLNTVSADDLAAVLIEPVQGEGGFYPAPKAYLQGLRELCTEHGILLICDEVQTGFGRTARWAAYEHYDILPDISTWAKSMGAGLPIGCVIGRAEIMDKAVVGTIGGTYPGNPVACAGALANIKYMEQLDINAKGKEVGEVIRQRFEAMQAKCPAVGDVRGIGAMLAFELVKDNDPKKPDAELCGALVKACLDRGLIIISAGTHKNIIRILSPLTIDKEHLNKGLDIIEEELLRLYS